MPDVKKYREAVGSLIYLTTCTCPDLCFVVSKLSQHFADPTDEHWVTVKHVLRYLRGTADKQVFFRKSRESLGLQAYSDADWAADASDRRSTTGYCVSMGKDSSLVSWKAKKQPTVALSTCEAEYMALALTIQECIYLEQLPMCIRKLLFMTITRGQLRWLGTLCVDKDVSMWTLNITSFVREDKMSLVYCPTDDMVADVMTKPASRLKLRKFAGVMFGV